MGIKRHLSAATLLLGVVVVIMSGCGGGNECGRAIADEFNAQGAPGRYGSVTIDSAYNEGDAVVVPVDLGAGGFVFPDTFDTDALKSRMTSLVRNPDTALVQRLDSAGLKLIYRMIDAEGKSRDVVLAPSDLIPG